MADATVPTQPARTTMPVSEIDIGLVSPHLTRAVLLDDAVIPLEVAAPDPAIVAENAALRAEIAAIGDAALLAENQRIAGIQAKCAKFPLIAADAIEKGWTVAQAENAALRAGLADPKIRATSLDGPNIITGAGRYETGVQCVGAGVSVGDALEAAVRLSLGSKVERDYSAAVLEAAHENFRNITLQGLLAVAAEANGYQGSTFVTAGNLASVLRAASPERSAGVSTVSLPGILGAVANRELLAGYMEEDRTWRKVAKVGRVDNFHAAKSYRLLDDMEYEELSPGGKIKQGSVSEESYTRQAKTFAKMFTVTRRDMINDNLGALADVRTRLGRGSGKKVSSLAWRTFLDNAAFFLAARTNYISGPLTALGADGVALSLALTAFRQMRSPSADGYKSVGGGSPSILLVPPELEEPAMKLYLNDNAGAVASGDVNIHAGKYEPVVSVQLSDPAYTGY